MSQFFQFLNTAELRYCVVGANAAGFDDSLGGDIDIVVEEFEIQDLICLLFDFSHANGVEVVQVLRHERSAWYFVLASFGGDGRPRFLHPDICSDYRRGGRLFLTAREIVAGRVQAVDETERALGYYTPAPAMEFIYYLMKKIDKRTLDARHGSHLSAVWGKDPVNAAVQLRRLWPDAEVGLLARAARDDEWSAVRAELPRLRRSLRARLPYSVQARGRELLRLLRRVAQPTGLCVAVLGPDGSGKSSVIARAVPTVAPAFRRTCTLHLRPRLGMATGGARAPVTRPHGEAARGWVASVAKAFYLLADYTLGYAVKVWPLRVRSTCVVFDRYYHDLLVDPRRYRYGGPMWLARWVGKLVPKPDLWILLDAPAEVLRARKQEVPLAESARQRRAYLDLAARLDSAVVIDAAQPLEQVAADATQAILDFMAKRTERRRRPKKHGA